MLLIPSFWLLPAFLAAVLLADVVLSIRPVRFIRDCLESVHFPEDWWWILLVVKVLAAAGLIAGIWIPGVAFAANLGVVVYFLCATVAHIRAKATGLAFWLNCLGMLMLFSVILVLTIG